MRIQNKENLRILFMGDSITAVTQWVPMFNEVVRPAHFVNIAVSAATWADREGTVYDGDPVFGVEGAITHNTIGNQIEKLLRGKDPAHPHYRHNSDYDDFDIIIVSAGTNDAVFAAPLTVDEVNRQFIDENGALLPLERVDRKTWPGAMRYAYENLRRLYPEAAIFYCSPIQAAESVRSFSSIRIKSQVMRLICERISDVGFIDTFCCGICGIYETWDVCGRDLADGLHPNPNGSKKIAEYNARAVKSYLF